MTIHECVRRLAKLAHSPDFLAKVDGEVQSFLMQFHRDPTAIAQAKEALVDALQKAPDFATKGRILDRIAGVAT
jgi:hypothetical protein